MQSADPYVYLRILYISYWSDLTHYFVKIVINDDNFITQLLSEH
jgi:hypothetical protein